VREYPSDTLSIRWTISLSKLGFAGCAERGAEALQMTMSTTACASRADAYVTFNLI
jgi:hypothetical protein